MYDKTLLKISSSLLHVLGERTAPFALLGELDEARKDRYKALEQKRILDMIKRNRK